MRAADALFKALKAEGVEHVFGIPGGANLPTYDALYDADLTHIQARHEQGAGHAAEGYAKASGRVGVALRHLGPRRDQPGHRDRRRDDGLGADRVHHRPGAHRPDRHRRLPGGRRHRDHDAGRQALVAGHRPAPDPRVHPRGLPHRLHRPPRPGAGRHPAGPLAGRHRVRAAGGHAEPARLQAADRGQHQADPDRRQGARQRAPAGDLRRRRDRQRQRLRGVPRVLRLRPAPGDPDRDGPGRVPGAARAVARDARHARHPDRQLRDGRGRPDRLRRRPLRRPDHRQALRVRAAGEVRPHRRRPGRDLEERPGPHPDRRRRQGRAAEAHPRVPGAEARRGRGSTSGGSRSASGRRPTRCATRTRATPRSSRSS